VSAVVDAGIEGNGIGAERVVDLLLADSSFDPRDDERAVVGNARAGGEEVGALRSERNRRERRDRTDELVAVFGGRGHEAMRLTQDVAVSRAERKPIRRAGGAWCAALSTFWWL
jgi:hypothetical protein